MKNSLVIEKELKQIVIILSSQFMKDHPRSEEPTYFRESILLCLEDGEMPFIMDDGTALFPKCHTCRADYEGWVEKIEQVNRGEAVLRVVCWSGIAYRSKWLDIITLTKDDGIGVQKLGFSSGKIDYPFIDFDKITNLSINEISKNDGLLLQDFKDWFKGYDLSQPMAIIHFTKFRY